MKRRGVLDVPTSGLREKETLPGVVAHKSIFQGRWKKAKEHALPTVMKGLKALSDERQMQDKRPMKDDSSKTLQEVTS